MAAKRKCKHCGAFKRKSEGFISRNNMFFCSVDHAVEWAKTEEAKKKAKRIKKESERKARVKLKEDKQRIKSYRQKLSEMQSIFNKLRRLQELKWFKDRGQEPTCISCGKPLGSDQWCNGHFKTVGARPDLRFDPVNSYLQHNHRCNKMLSGDIEGYKQGLKRRFGEDEARRIMDYCNQEQPVIKWSDDEIAHIKQLWRKEIRELERELAQ